MVSSWSGRNFVMWEWVKADSENFTILKSIFLCKISSCRTMEIQDRTLHSLQSDLDLNRQQMVLESRLKHMG